MSLAAQVREGNRLALARLLTKIENNEPEGRQVLNELFPYTGKAHLIGVTGAPGTGKSSLVNRLALFYRQMPVADRKRVAIVAVDPSSPFTGGAILGDRVRMRDLAGDTGVFIRSMASRGSLGGLAAATSGIVQAMDAAGFDIILIETVGAGQAEVDIARLAHTTLVIEAPGLGDDIQAIKAGILEIADILVINKADRPGVEVTERALRSMLELAHPAPRIFHNHAHRFNEPAYTENLRNVEIISEDEPFWQTPIHKTVAVEGEGISELAAAITDHVRYLKDSGQYSQREKARLQSELDVLLQETLVSRWRSQVTEDDYRRVLDRLVQRRLSPYQAVSVLLDGGEV